MYTTDDLAGMLVFAIFVAIAVYFGMKYRAWGRSHYNNRPR